MLPELQTVQSELLGPEHVEQLEAQLWQNRLESGYSPVEQDVTQSSLAKLTYWLEGQCMH